MKKLIIISLIIILILGISHHHIMSQENEDILSYQLAYEANGTIQLLNLEQFTVKAIINPAISNFAPDWNKDGTLIVFSSVVDADGNVDIFIYDILQDELYNIVSDPSVDAYPKWSSDDNSILFITDRQNYTSPYLFNLQQGDIFPMFSFDSHVSNVNWGRSPNEILYVKVSVSDNLQSIDIFRHILNQSPTMIVSGQRHDYPLQSNQSGYYSIYQPSLSPDGNQLVYTYFFVTTRIVLHDVVSGSERILTDINKNYAFPNWSPDGHCISFTELEQGFPNGIWVYDLRTNDMMLLPLEHDDANNLAWAGNTTCDDVLNWVSNVNSE